MYPQLQSEGSWDRESDQFKMAPRGGLFFILFSSPVSSPNINMPLHLSFILFPSLCPPLLQRLPRFLALSSFPLSITSILTSFCILLSQCLIFGHFLPSDLPPLFFYPPNFSPAFRTPSLSSNYITLFPSCLFSTLVWPLLYCLLIASILSAPTFLPH